MYYINSQNRITTTTKRCLRYWYRTYNYIKVITTIRVYCVEFVVVDILLVRRTTKNPIQRSAPSKHTCQLLQGTNMDPKPRYASPSITPLALQQSPTKMHHNDS